MTRSSIRQSRFLLVLPLLAGCAAPALPGGGKQLQVAVAGSGGMRVASIMHGTDASGDYGGHLYTSAVLETALAAPSFEVDLGPAVAYWQYLPSYHVASGALAVIEPHIDDVEGFRARVMIYDEGTPAPRVRLEPYEADSLAEMVLSPLGEHLSLVHLRCDSQNEVVDRISWSLEIRSARDGSLERDAAGEVVVEPMADYECASATAYGLLRPVQDALIGPSFAMVWSPGDDGVHIAERHSDGVAFRFVGVSGAAPVHFPACFLGPTSPTQTSCTATGSLGQDPSTGELISLERCDDVRYEDLPWSPEPPTALVECAPLQSRW